MTRLLVGAGDVDPGARLADLAVPEQASVLVIAADDGLRGALTAIGDQHGFRMHFGADGREGVRLAQQSDADLIVLDLSLPGMTGFDVCRKLRGSGIEAPIIIVSPRADPVDVVVGLEIGADDYVVKPFEVRELAARINAKLRRHRSSATQVRAGRVKYPGLVVDVGRHEVLRDGKPVTLTPTEFDLLALLCAAPGRVVSRTEMIQKVWGRDADLDLRSVDAHVYRLRRKIEPDSPRPTYIHAVPGIGYRFERRGLTDRLARAREGEGDHDGEGSEDAAEE